MRAMRCGYEFPRVAKDMVVCALCKSYIHHTPGSRMDYERAIKMHRSTCRVAKHFNSDQEDGDGR